MPQLFEHSCLATRSELDLFSNLPTQAALTDGFTTEYQPIGSLTDDSVIKFHVSGDSNFYMDLAESYIYFQLKITKEDGTNLVDNDTVGPINLICHSLFQQLDISLNDVLISEASNLYHYRSIIETLLSYGQDAKNSQLTLSLYSKDKATKMDDIADANSGLVQRRKYFKNSKTVEVIGKVHGDIFRQERFLLNGVDLKLKLIRNPDKFVLMAANDATFRLKIVGASFFVRKVKINDGIQLKHIEKLDKELLPALYPTRRVSMKTYSIATGSLSSNETIYSGILPKRIVFGIVNSAAMEGAYDKNPFNFKHHNLNYCSLLQDGKMIPQKPLQPSFTKSLSLRNYFTLVESTGKAFSDIGIDIDRSEYEGGYALLVFDLTPGMDPDHCFHIPKTGTIRSELKFSTALTEPVNVILYAEFDSSIHIDKNRAVMTNYYS
jgi:hypothetical protein